MSRYVESTSLIPNRLVQDLLDEVRELEGMIATSSDPWQLRVAGGGVRGSEAGGHHGIDDPMRAVILDHHRRDPLSERDMFFWYHSVTSPEIEVALGRSSALASLEHFVHTDTVRATLGEQTGVALAPGADLTLSLTRFGPGAFLAPHTDYVPDGTYALTLVLFLNEDWHPYFGGQLVVREARSWRTIQPTAGRLLMFEPSDETDHYVQMVNPCAPKARYAVSGWFHRTACGLAV